MGQTSSKDKLVSDIQEVIKDAEILVKETADDLTGKAKEARNRLAGQLDTAKVRIKEWEGVVKDKAVEGAKETDRVIREHPYESLGVAFGVGLLIGILINRK